MRLISVLIFTSLFFVANLHAQDPYAADRTQLKAMLSEIETAINKQNIELLISHLQDDVVVTFLNAEVARGIPAVRAYFEKTLGGDNALLTQYRTRAKVTAPAVFYENVALAEGSAKDEFIFGDGMSMSVDTLWSAAVVQQGEQWKVAQLHFSTNIFENALLNSAKKSILIFSLITAVTGLVIGFLVGRKMH